MVALHGPTTTIAGKVVLDENITLVSFLRFFLERFPQLAKKKNI